MILVSNIEKNGLRKESILSYRYSNQTDSYKYSLWSEYWTQHYWKHLNTGLFCFLNPPASKASREVANSTERKNLHTLYSRIVCLSACLSVRLWQTLTPIISGLAEQNGLYHSLCVLIVSLLSIIYLFPAIQLLVTVIK